MDLVPAADRQREIALDVLRASAFAFAAFGVAGLIQGRPAGATTVVVSVVGWSLLAVVSVVIGAARHQRALSGAQPLPVPMQLVTHQDTPRAAGLLVLIVVAAGIALALGVHCSGVAWHACPAGAAIGLRLLSDARFSARHRLLAPAAGPLRPLYAPPV